MPRTLPPDIEIARAASPRYITEVAAELGLAREEIDRHGKHIAKLGYPCLKRIEGLPEGKLILVTAMTPTPTGEGKTTTSVGLAQAMRRLGKKATVVLREPSMGPVFGIKGGAAGGGMSQVLPMEKINLHFTGDIHAVTTATNLLSAIVDNHVFHGNSLRVDPRRVVWSRCLDMNDRSLRKVVLGLGGPLQGIPREDSFDITAASEIMAIFCLSKSLADLKERLGRVIVAYTRKSEPIRVAAFAVEGALAAVMRDAFKPNLVQTLEGGPALIHGGPFANIAHGCNSLVATRTALHLSDYVVTEAGFGADLGAEKFFNIKCRAGGLTPRAAVLVATVKAMRWHGGAAKEKLHAPDLEAVKRGFENLEKHIESVSAFGLRPVVALNRFSDDSEAETGWILEALAARGLPCALSEVWEKGGEGGLALARLVLEAVEKPSSFRLLYRDEDAPAEKIRAIASAVYGAGRVKFSQEAEHALDHAADIGMERAPVCMAKTQFSFSDDPALRGRPRDFSLHVKRVRPSAGAGFLVAFTGDIRTMPGLPVQPSAEAIDVDEEGRIYGLF
jgi:formate--tetrahydrofolate ligase